MIPQIVFFTYDQLEDAHSDGNTGIHTSQNDLLEGAQIVENKVEFVSDSLERK